MLGDFDIQSAAQKILSAGDLAETQNLESGLFDGKDANVFVKGNVAGGAVIRGTQSLLVEGWLIGNEDSPCRVQVEGDVVVTGDVAYAQIIGRSIRIGVNARRCLLRSRRDIEVGSDLSGTRIVAGEFDIEKQGIARLTQKILRSEKDRGVTEEQLGFEQKRVYKELSSTRFSLEYSIGQVVRHRIIQHGRRQIVMDLQPLYALVGGRTEEEIDRAIMEFFSTAVVGQLVRINQVLIEISPHRKRIFMGVIRRLNDLFILVRKRDKQSSQIAEDEAELTKLVDALDSQAGSAVVYVRGTVRPNIDLQFLLPEVERLEDGETSIGTRTAKLAVRWDAGSQQLEVRREDIGGEVSVQSPNPEELQRISVQMQEGRIEWERMSPAREEDTQ